MENTVTASLSKRTLQPRSQSLPMPSKLCWNVGMIWQSQAGRVGRLRLADTEEMWTQTEASPTWDAGACRLMSQIVAVGVTYMSLVPVLEMAVSEMGMSGGVGLQIGGAGLQLGR